MDVYFDGKCGLCSKEIAHYRSLPGAEHLRWHDIASDPSPLREVGVSQADALMALHVRREDGRLVKGVDAFIAIWNRFPRWRLLGRLAGLPLVHGLAQRAYDVFAKRRFARLEHCQVAAREPEPVAEAIR